MDAKSIERAVMADQNRPCLYGVAGPCMHPDCLVAHFRTLQVKHETMTASADLVGLADKWKADAELALRAGEGDKHCALWNCAAELRALAGAEVGVVQHNALWCKVASERLPPWQWNMVNDRVRVLENEAKTPPGSGRGG